MPNKRSGLTIFGKRYVIQDFGQRGLKKPLRMLCLAAIALFSSSGCGFFAARSIEGQDTPTPTSFSFVGDKSPCYLELLDADKALRMNCFHIDGVLHIHSSRWSKLPRFSGESWTVAIRRQPQVRIEIGDKVYAMAATPIDDEDLRQEILHNRGYWYAWDGITVFHFSDV